MEKLLSEDKELAEDVVKLLAQQLRQVRSQLSDCKQVIIHWHSSTRRQGMLILMLPPYYALNRSFRPVYLPKMKSFLLCINSTPSLRMKLFRLGSVWTSYASVSSSRD